MEKLLALILLCQVAGKKSRLIKILNDEIKSVL